MTTAKQMTLMVAIPGAGKSTLAAQMKATAEAKGKTCVICSTDDQFIINGSYQFNPSLLFKNHLANQNKARDACREGINSVIIDNTNLNAKHRQVYEEIAAEFGYDCTTIVVGEFTPEFAKVCAERNRHGVPLESILRMARSVQLPQKSG